MQFLLLYLPLKVPYLYVKYAYFVLYLIFFLTYYITVFDKIQFYQFRNKSINLCNFYYYIYL